MNVNLVLGVTTLGKSNLLLSQLESLECQTDLDFTFILCDQSKGALKDYLSTLEASPIRNKIVSSQRLGASRGRNLIINSAPVSATHFIFPNDTSTFPPDFVEQVKQVSANQDLVVLGYSEVGRLRYKFEPGNYSLNQNNVWNAIEPATVFSSAVLNFAGGFDEALGSGVEGPFRSGEGTDLILRVREKITKISWMPSIRVIGVPQSYSLNNREHQRKLYYYGRGYGHVLRMHNYSWQRKLASIAGPFLKRDVFSGGFQGLINALYSSTGRAISLFSIRRHRN